MSDNVGVYIPVHEDEYLIRPCIEQVIKVFPQVEVIDLGSRDKTKDIVKSMNVPLHEFFAVSGAEYTALKNEFSKKHDWVFWVDADEIFPLKSLLNVKQRIENEIYPSVQSFWKLIKKEDGKLFISKGYRGGGRKAFSVKKHYFKRAWPREVLESYEKDIPRESSTEFNGIFCWHGVLLKRSSKPEPTGRRKKRQSKLSRYNRELKWEEIKKFPWKS